MNKFQERIKNDAMVPYIDLNESEKNLYNGAGDSILAVNEHGDVIDILYLGSIPDNAEYGFEKTEKISVYKAKMSCFQICNPILEV